MKSLVRIVLLLSYTLSTQAGAKDWAAEKWEFLYEKDDIKVFRKDVSGTNMKGVAGEGIVDASPAKIIFTLLDHEHKSEWIEHFGEAHDVEDHPPEYNVQYSIFNLPFPVSDRDFVVRNDFSIDTKLKAMIVDVHSVDMKQEPEKKGFVRGNLVEGRFIMTPLGPNKTLIQAEYLTDPKGMIPSWLVNMLQKEWPYKTLSALRLHLKKPYVKDWEPYNTFWKPKLEALSTAAAAAPSAIVK